MSSSTSTSTSSSDNESPPCASAPYDSPPAFHPPPSALASWDDGTENQEPAQGQEGNSISSSSSSSPNKLLAARMKMVGLLRLCLLPLCSHAPSHSCSSSVLHWQPLLRNGQSPPPHCHSLAFNSA
jgi:hypothetical protein